MRGAQLDYELEPLGLRIIPAYAGSTRACTAVWLWYRDHPRVCGEHSYIKHRTAFFRGSSPRMRGARRPRHALGAAQGIIPAYAGSTRQIRGSERLFQDHPRVCGEHAGRQGNKVLRQGSSPRMRGALRMTKKIKWLSRIIPAYAGSTDWC